MWTPRGGTRPRLHDYCAELQKGGAASAREAARQTSRRSFRRVSAVDATRDFPMFVVRVADFLSMAEARPHQVLRAQGVAVEFAPALGVAIFVSHQWCSRRHPDPSFHQLGVLQGVFRNAMQGKVTLRVDLLSKIVYHTKPSFTTRDIPRWVSGCIWYDYFSVPQPDAPEAQSDQHVDMAQALGTAVMCIPSFVNACEVFMILAPPLPHVDEPSLIVDYRSWKGRGWCRLERVARLLSPRNTHILLVPDAQNLVQVGALDYLYQPVGEGEFTVGSDRARLALVVLGLLTEKLGALLRAGDLHRYRKLLSFRVSMLRGLPAVDPLDCAAAGFRPLPCGDAVERFLDLYGFRSAVDCSDRGGPPILFAAALGDPELVRGLLARRASLESRVPHGTAEFLTHKGVNVLHVACGINDPAFMGMLIEEQADVEATDVRGITPLMSAVVVSDAPVVAVLLAARANALARSRLGTSTLCFAAITGRHENIRQLLAAGVPAAAEGDGLGPLFHAVLNGAGADTVAALLTAADCDMDEPCSPKAPWVRAVLGAFSLQYSLGGSRTQFAVLGYHCWRATPLAIAAIVGSIAEARALVAAGANTEARNARGKTAAELAELVGLSPANIAVFQGATGAVGPADSAQE